MHPAIKVAMACIKTPFKHQGRIAGLALDCAGLFVHVCRELDLPYQDAKGYPRSPYDGQLEKQLESQPCLERIAVSDIKEGDILCMRITRAPQHIAFHAGTIEGLPYIIHASEMHGGVVHHRLDKGWSSKIMRAYRFVGVEA